MPRHAWLLSVLFFLALAAVNQVVDAWLESSETLGEVGALLGRELRINVVTLLLAAFGIAVSVYLYFLENERRLAARLTESEAELAVARDRLHDASLLKYVDRTTRIPNELRWEEDLARIAARVSADQPHHVAMIDLIGFGRINREAGYDAADRIIRHVAQDIQGAMRRREYIYKNAMEEPSESYFQDRIYRKFSGGDEFVLIAAGPEFEIIGLLNRIARNGGRYTRFAREMGVDWTFAFDAGVCPIERGDTPELARRRVESCLQVARRENRALGIYWYSETDPDDPALAGWAAKSYRDAVELFARGGRAVTSETGTPG